MHWAQWRTRKQTLLLVKQLSQQHLVRGQVQSSLHHASELSLTVSKNDQLIIVICESSVLLHPQQSTPGQYLEFISGLD